MRAGQDRLKERSLGWVGLGLGQPWVRVGNCESRFGTRVKVWIEKSSVGPGRPRVTNRLQIAEAYTNLKEVRKAMTWLRKRLRSQADFRTGLCTLEALKPHSEHQESAEDQEMACSHSEKVRNIHRSLRDHS